MILRGAKRKVEITTTKTTASTKIIKLEESKIECIVSKSEKIKETTIDNDIDDDEEEVMIHRARPKNWEQIYKLIRAFRKENHAAVDSQGCHMLFDPATDAKSRRYQILTSLQLSSQTKDPVNAQAMSNLKGYFQANGIGFNATTIIAMDPKVLNSLINKVGFHNRKTIYIQQTALVLQEKYDGDVPQTIEELLELPGIGPKMGYLALQIAWDINEGIGVDVHVHRISNRLGWVKSKTPEQTRMQLQDWLPRDKWADINDLLVGFGQTKCTPLRPDCSTCPVKNLCPKIGTKSKVVK